MAVDRRVVRGRIGRLVAAVGRLGRADRGDRLAAAREQPEVDVVGEQIDVIDAGREPVGAVTGPADLAVGERLVEAGHVAADDLLDEGIEGVELRLRRRVDAQVEATIARARGSVSVRFKPGERSTHSR